jgi:hypothetical protein
MLTLAACAAAFALSPERAAVAQRRPDAGTPPPPLPAFDAQPFPDEKTPRPTLDEWKPAQPVALTTPLLSRCNAYRVREWVKIDCGGFGTSSIALLGGEREGVALFLRPLPPNNSVPEGGEVMFPVRRGDRRVLEWSTFGDAYDGPGTPEVAFMISESWAPADAGPTIVVR